MFHRALIVLLALYVFPLVEMREHQEPPVEVAADHRVELFAIMWRMAGSDVFSQGGLEPYVTEAERHFGPHGDHPAIARARDLLETGVDFSAVMSIAIHMSDPYTLREKVAFDAPGGVLDRYGMPEDQRTQFLAGVRTFLEEARRFVTDARAREFFGARRTIYDSASARLRGVVHEHVDLAWFERFFGVPPGGDVVVIPLLAASEVNFGPQLTGPGIRPERYAILGVQDDGVDSLGLPLYEASVVRTLVHEINHSFVNDLLTAHEERFSESGPAVFEEVAEALVDAAKARYVAAREGGEAARREVERLEREGHVYMGELFDLLGEYEAERRRYPTLDVFMPRIAEFYDSLPMRVEDMKTSKVEPVQTPKCEDGVQRDGCHVAAVASPASWARVPRHRRRQPLNARRNHQGATVDSRGRRQRGPFH